MLENHTGHTLQIDISAARPVAGAPVYDGDFWTFPSGGSIRCSLPIEAQDYVTSWIIYGRHPSGPVLTSACLQLLELPQGEGHYDVGPAGAPADYGLGALALQATLPGDGFGVSEDFALSLIIHGAPGDKIGGASVEVMRLP